MKASFRLIACLLTLGTTVARGGGLSPEAAKRAMTLPPGFDVEVFASEPEIRQPVASCFDERGRMWVIEYLQYPNPAGLVPVKVDQYLRTKYDRMPDPPPKGPRGADRIKILEDTDGDGKADKVTTFLEGLNLASAIAVGRGGVFVGQAPYLLFYPDRDRDDRPDGDPEVLLAGFGMEDAHATVNSLAWGPDGWLYGAQGSTVTADIRGIGFQQGIWRYHPESKRFELFAEGGGNTWGLDFDRLGNAFGSSNGSFVAFHMVQGGYYWKGFAKHGPLHNPRAYGYFNCIDYAGPKPGGHVTPGGIIYKGDTFPPEFRGQFLGANLLSNSVYWYKLAPKGSTYSMTLGGTLLDSHDPWFRPIDLLTGPDGSVFVVDWYDKRASHLDPRDTWDRSNGRIYKISYGGHREIAPFDLSKEKTDALIDLRSRPNDWWADTARRILFERKDAAAIPRLKALVDEDRDPELAMRDLWALDACGGIGEAEARALLDHALPAVRRWVVRLIGDGGKPSGETIERLIRLADAEPDVRVRSQLASTIGRWPPGQGLPILEHLVRRSEDANDPHVPMLLWWAAEAMMRTDASAVVDRLGPIAAGPGPEARLTKTHLLGRMARALAEDGSPEALERASRLLTSVNDPEAAEAVLSAIDKGLEGRSERSVPSSLATAVRVLWDRGDRGLPIVRLANRIGLSPASRFAIETVLDPKTPEAMRSGLVEVLGQRPSADGRVALLRLVSSTSPVAVRLSALNALAAFPDVEVAEALIAGYARWPTAMKDRARDLLCGRKTWASRLVEAIGSGSIAARDLTNGQAVRIAALGDADLTSRLAAAWGHIPGTNGPGKAKRIAEVRGILPEGDKGDASRGREVFLKTCSACHRLFGEGERIGPELTGAERGNLDFLLNSLVDPSSEIRKEYQGQTLALKDGRVLSGLVIEESGGAVVLFDSQKQKTTIARSEIEATKPSDVSVMPEGLLDALTETQIRDLFRYLQK